MKSYRNRLVALLVLLVALPLNTAAASWMSLGMPGHDAALTASLDLNAAGPNHHADGVHHHEPAALDSQETGADECDDHCMNCSTHCFSAALVAITGESANPVGYVSAPSEGGSLSRAYPLFRPPILEIRLGRSSEFA